MRSDIVHVSSITKLEFMKSVCFVLSMLIFLIQAVIFVVAIGEGVDVILTMKLNTMAIISIHSWFRSKAKGRNLTSLNVQNNADTDLSSERVMRHALKQTVE